MTLFAKIKQSLATKSVVGTVLRAAMGSIGVRGCAALLGLGVMVLLTRLLGKDGLGVYVYVLSTANLLTLIAVFGFDRVIIREIGVAAASRNWGLLRGVTRISNLFSFGLAVILGGGLVLLTFAWPELFDPRYLTPFRALAVLVPLLTIGHIQQATIRGLRWVVSSQIPQQILRPGFMLLALAIMVFLAHELSAREALFWMAGAILIGFLIGGLILWRVRPADLGNAKPVYETRKWLLISLPVMGVALANKGSGDIASIILGTVNSPDELADFTISRQMARFLRFFFIAINLSIAPTIAHLFAAGRIEELKQLGPRTVRFAMMLALPLGLAMLVFPEFFLGVYGEEYLDQAQVFRVMVCMEMSNIMLGSVSIWLMMTGHERLALRGAIVGLVVGIVTNLLLAPSMGAMGTAIAMFFALLVTKLLLWRYIHNRLGINPTLFGRA